MDKLPREKLIEDGVDVLRDDELLAIMLATGGAKENVFMMSKRLCETYGFSKLYQMSYQELSSIPGIKEGKATKLMAVFEIVKRIMKEEASKKKLIASKDVFDYVYPYYMGLKKEKMIVIYVNSELGVMGMREYSSDSYTKIDTPIRKIVEGCIESDCYGIFMIHNHPAGNPNPSESDKEYTWRLEFALKAIGILLLDHVIISKDSYYSFTDHGNKGNPFDF